MLYKITEREASVASMRFKPDLFVADADVLFFFTQMTCYIRGPLKKRLKPGQGGWGFGGIKRLGEGGSEGVQNHLFRTFHIHELIHRSLILFKGRTYKHFFYSAIF